MHSIHLIMHFVLTIMHRNWLQCSKATLLFELHHIYNTNICLYIYCNYCLLCLSLLVSDVSPCTSLQGNVTPLPRRLRLVRTTSSTWYTFCAFSLVHLRIVSCLIGFGCPFSFLLHNKETIVVCESLINDESEHYKNDVNLLLLLLPCNLYHCLWCCL